MPTESANIPRCEEESRRGRTRECEELENRTIRDARKWFQPLPDEAREGDQETRECEETRVRTIRECEKVAPQPQPAMRGGGGGVDDTTRSCEEVMTTARPAMRGSANGGATRSCEEAPPEPCSPLVRERRASLTAQKNRNLGGL